MTGALSPLRVASAITPHGFGHAAVTVAVLDALDRRHPGGLDVTFVSMVPEALLRARWGRPCRVVAHAAATDFGMLMSSSTNIRTADTMTAYVDAHARWDTIVAQEAAVLAELAPDVVLSCVSYATLAAAQRLSLPNIGLGPFTWYEIVSTYASGYPEVSAVLRTMNEVYSHADAMIATMPAVAMDLPNLRGVGPVGTPGQARRADLASALGLTEGERVALVALGGIAEDLPVAEWPHVPGWRFIVADEAGMSVSDAVASCDAVITKPGYGTFVEAGCAGTPLIYRDRPDWPETQGMARWLSAHVPCLSVDAETFAIGAFENHLRMLMQMPRGPRAEPSGNGQAAGIILDIMGGGG